MTKTIAVGVLILFFLLLTFSFSARTYAQEKQLTFSYLDYVKHAVIVLTYITPIPHEILSIAIKPSVMPTTTPTAIPVVQKSAIADFLLNAVNKYRSTFGLPPVQSNTQTCAFAAVRAKEITNHFSHDGFNSRVSNHTIPYANWDRATENIAEAPDYKEVVDLWAKSPEHAANMRDNTPYVCIEKSGPYYAYEGMRP